MSVISPKCLSFDVGLMLIGMIAEITWSSWLISFVMGSIDVVNDVIGFNADTRDLIWSWWWLPLLMLWPVLLLRFERVDAADVLLLLREPRREPFFSINWKQKTNKLNSESKSNKHRDRTLTFSMRTKKMVWTRASTKMNFDNKINK